MTAPSLPQSAARLFVAALVLLPPVAMVMPRFLTLGPPLIALFAVAAFYHANRTFPRFSKTAMLWALAFPALMALSALWGIAPETSFMRGVKTLPVILSAPVLWDFGRGLDEKSFTWFKKYFPLAVMGCALFCIAELYGNAPLYRLIHSLQHSQKRFGFSGLNRSIVVLTLCALPAFFFVRGEKFLMPALIAMMAAVLLATSSQSVQLAVFLALVFYFAFPYRQTWAYPALAVLLAALLFAAPFLASFLFHHVAGTTGQTAWLRNSYVDCRLEIWDFVSRRALQRPFLGFGAEAARKITDFDSAKIYWPTTRVLHPHNFAIQLWIEFGALGAVTGALFFGHLLRHMQKLDTPQARALLPLFITALSIAATSYGLWQSWWLGLFCLLFAYAAIIVRKPQS